MDEELDFNSSDDELTEFGRQAIEDLLAENWNSEENKVWDLI
jgi:hypothetical protein